MNRHASDRRFERSIQDEMIDEARDAGLHYGGGEDAGYWRKKWGKGFTYLREDGSHVTEDEERERIESLAIPPDWRDVWIAADPERHVQAVGRDSAGRKQYIYHPKWEEVRERVKFRHLIEFARKLPEVRKRADRDMRRRKLTRERAVAIAVTLLDRTLLRVGHEEYARQHGHYGLTTLRREHVDCTTSSVTFDFTGKSEVEQSVRLADRRLARQVQRLLELPGDRLFGYEDERGEIRKITPAEINDYLCETAGLQCSSKDFRTWGATRTFVEYLLGFGSPTSDDERETYLREAVRRTAETLSNTERVCRSSYLHPAVIEAYEAGRFWESWDGFDFDEAEYLAKPEAFVVHLTY